MNHGRARDEALVAAALVLRERQPTWSPKKLRRKLAERWPDLAPPALSTIGDWLRKEGLTQARRSRGRCPPFSSPFQAVDAPNAVWCAPSIRLHSTAGCVPDVTSSPRRPQPCAT